ncbi:putative NBD/HSP70 family sugar kinase [Amaricoccus macauensis]|uniref:Putative NBD/HSP70 family sugar kinase n=1 Tax=Amaricoccus macauensis TaxID=57001 RepID=A0A840SGC2_9RHOB|nr:ROK family transcriptional regulator [Amaricoccus macauensis]MBB5220917.1 putative NBD/HSP70 family sugar kinase [Amaricoccus macauensis]
MLDPGLTSVSSRRIRQSNEIAVLRALHRIGPLSRADLARTLRLNRSSSGHIVASLLGLGLVRETAVATAQAEPARVGRPGILFELVPDAVFFLGIEIGVEHIRAVVIDLEGRIVAHRAEPFDGIATPPARATEVAVALALDTIAPERLGRCEGVGVTAPAQMDHDGLVRVAPILGWRAVDLPALLRQVVPEALPVMVENDGNAFAIGAIYGHSAPPVGVTLFLVLETGVGAGIAIDGALVRGGHGLAGEIGHMLVPDWAEAGRMRPLETVIGLEAVLAAYAAGRGVERSTLAEFLARVRDREPAAVMIAESWSRTLAFALVQAARLIDPDHVVLGGSLAALYPLVSARVIAHVRAIQEATFPIPAIVTHQSEWASAFGAACMLHQRFLSLEGQGAPDRPSAPDGVADGAVDNAGDDGPVG